MQVGDTHIFLTVVTSVISGVLIFLAGQILLKFALEPIQAFYQLKGKITDSLIYYSNIYLHPGGVRDEIMHEASNALRQQAGELLGKAQMIPLYSFWAFWGLIPCRQNLFKAHRNIIGLSNSVFGGGGASSADNDRRRRYIIDALGLRIEETTE